MGLPFLKESKGPRVARPEEGKLPEEKIINGSDDDTIMSHVASECMEAIQTGDNEKFINALQVIIDHRINKMQEPESEGE